VADLQVAGSAGGYEVRRVVAGLVPAEGVVYLVGGCGAGSPDLELASVVVP